MISTDIERMLDEARKLAQIHPHVVVKMPLTEDGIRATKKVSEEGIKVIEHLIKILMMSEPGFVGLRDCQDSIVVGSEAIKNQVNPLIP